MVLIFMDKSRPLAIFFPFVPACSTDLNYEAILIDNQFIIQTRQQ